MDIKKSLPVLLALCAAFAADAESLRIEMNDGTAQYYDLTTRPVVRFHDDVMSVTSAEIASEYRRADVKKCTFTDLSTVADNIRKDDVTYSYDGSTFSCHGHDIAVFDLRGMNVAAGYGEVSLTVLPAGIYIVKTNNQTIKIIK